MINADKSWSKEAGGGDCGGDTASTCSGRTISSSVLSVKEAAVKPKEVKKDSPAAKSSTSRPGERGGGVSSYQSILQKYSKYNLPSASSPKLNRNSSDGQSCSPQLHRKVTEEKKDTSFDWLRAPVKQTAYTRVSQFSSENFSQCKSAIWRKVQKRALRFNIFLRHYMTPKPIWATVRSVISLICF